jgi:hypothetical protein
MVLRAYFDASKSNPLNVTCVAGHIGDEDAWSKLEREWQKGLDDWPALQGRFHLVDLRNQLGADMAPLCVRRFAKIIHDSGVRGFSAGMRDEDWDVLRADWSGADRETFPSRYHFTLDMLLGHLSMQIGLNLPDEDVLVSLDFDAPAEPTREIFKRWAAHNPRLAGLAILDFPSNRIKPMEAADLYAGVLRRDWAQRGFEAERKSHLYGPITWDDRARMHAAGKGSYGSMWSAQIAQKIADIQAQIAKTSSEST